MGPSIADKQRRAEELADELLGTCRTLNEEAPDVLDDIDVCEHLDELVRCCETCSWWVEADDVDDDGNCEDCRCHSD